MQVSTIVISKISIHIDSVPYNFQEIEIVVLDCHKLSLHVAHVDHELLHPEQIKSVVHTTYLYCNGFAGSYIHVIEFNCFTLSNFRSVIDGSREIRNMKGIIYKAFHSTRQIALLFAFP